MKKIVFAVIGLTLLASCSVKSNEEKALELIEPQIKASLIKPESYELAKLQLDSSFSNSGTSPETFIFLTKINKLYNEYKEHMRDVELAESALSIFASSYGYQSEYEKQQQRKYKADLEKAQRKAASAKEKILDLYKSNKELIMNESQEGEFIGWAADIAYRAETAGGLKIMNESLFFLNKDFTEITYSISEDDMIGVNPDIFQELSFEFENELQELFLEQ